MKDQAKLRKQGPRHKPPKAPRVGPRATGAVYSFRWLWAKQQGLCYYCHEKMAPAGAGHPYTQTSATRDHMLPKSRGGLAGANVVLACARCNNAKGSMTAEEFLVELGKASGGVSLA